MKLRMTAGPEWLLLGRALGANPVPMGMPEVYLALKTGTVDGQENPLSIVNAAKLYEVMGQVSLTAHMVQPVFIAIAKPAWERLSPAQQQGLGESARKQADWGDQARLQDEATIATTLVGRGLAVEPVELGAFQANADQVYAEPSKAWDHVPAACTSRISA
ncbi:MAG: TRAP transporter substrate-binding protein DctP [Acetobacteraceae bacterium]|nr:TRAP transporter substrate-binding protein DctP [Acetobacteraceae bacterium]